MRETWRIWDRDDSVEQRTYDRVMGKLPEMECSKQLVSLVREVYQPGMKVLDVGCAAGHYYNSLKPLDSEISYTGVDATRAYIEFAKNHFEKEENVRFDVQDVFNIDDSYSNEYDIVYCCNVLLHLPSISVPVRNIINSAKKYCFIRTLVSNHTHLSQYLYSDTFDTNGDPDNFVYENTYSFAYVKDLVEKEGCSAEFITDEFNPEAINKEFESHGDLQDAVTKSLDGLQIAGSKVFEWKWIKVTKEQ